jgi:hypothetical protein
MFTGDKEKMDAKEINSRLAEIDLFENYINSRIEHLANHQKHAQEKKDIEQYQAKQEQCGTILEYLEDRKSMLNSLKQTEIV